MDGGADTFLEYGFSSLAVRRYARGSTQVVVELYAMRDAGRRGGSLQLDAAPGQRDRDRARLHRQHRRQRGPRCPRRSLSRLPRREPDGEGRRSRARPLYAARRAARRRVRRGARFAGLPAEGRCPAPRSPLAGPLGLNQRAWLTALGREGFRRGVLAAYTSRAAGPRSFSPTTRAPSLRATR